jgi:hypothetical protein
LSESQIQNQPVAGGENLIAMTLEKYLQEKVNEFANQLAAAAPVDCCPDCCVCEGHLVFDGQTFEYECLLCRKHWSSKNLIIDANGKFQMLELAD